MRYYTPTLSVVVATYNRPRSLLRLLDQLNDQRCVDFRTIDVCVVDDGTEAPAMPKLYGGQGLDDGQSAVYDMTGWKYKFPLIYMWRRRHPQNLARVYSSRNIAASRTHGEYILQCDDDVEFCPYFLCMLTNWAGMATEQHWVWCARISNNIDVDRNGHSLASNWDRGPDGRWYDGRCYWHETHWGSADSSAMLMPRVTWNMIGGYDLDYDGAMGEADQDLAIRVQKLGKKPGDVKLWLYPAFVNKEDSETGSLRMEMINRRTRPESNAELFARKHPDAREWTNV